VNAERRTIRKLLATSLVLGGLAAGATALAWPNQPGSELARRGTGVARYEYIAGVGRLSVYDIATRALVGQFALPGVAEIRGIGASAATGMPYVSYGGFPDGIGHLLEFSLYRRTIVYDRGYRFGVDSFDISRDGRLIFMPTGENTSGTTWHVLSATTGRVVGAIAAGRAPHDTAIDASGRHVFLGGASARYLYEAGTKPPWRIVGKMGPFMPGGIAGIRPFTVDSQDRFAFTTGDRYLGFQVSDIKTGRVLYTVPVPGFRVPPTFGGLPSHGIALSPDERYLWLVDTPNRAVHEFDISGLPRRAPVIITTVHVSGPNLGWINLSRDGRYLFAGDAGNVINTQTRTSVGMVGALVDSRYNIEIDWAGHRVCAAYPRASLGYVHVPPQCGAPGG
jgi:DNA-binding beta-propeller fold protein YncE